MIGKLKKTDPDVPRIFLAYCRDGNSPQSFTKHLIGTKIAYYELVRTNEAFREVHNAFKKKTLKKYPWERIQNGPRVYQVDRTTN